MSFTTADLRLNSVETRITTLLSESCSLLFEYLKYMKAQSKGNVVSISINRMRAFVMTCAGKYRQYICEDIIETSRWRSTVIRLNNMFASLAIAGDIEMVRKGIYIVRKDGKLWQFVNENDSDGFCKYVLDIVARYTKAKS